MSMLDSQNAVHLAAMAAGLKRRHQIITSQMQGTSMGATLPSGAHIRIQCAYEASYRPGDIVVFILGTRLIAHRVIACGGFWKKRQVVITRGDALLLPDPPVPLEAVLGTVTAVQEATQWCEPGGAPACTPGWRLAATLTLIGTRLALTCGVPLAQRFVLSLRWGGVLLRRCRTVLRRHGSHGIQL